MTFRPTGYTAWAYSATNITAPIDSLRTTGWSTNEAPPSAYFNWLQNAVDRMLIYTNWRATLDTIVNDDFCYSGSAVGVGGTGLGKTDEWYYTAGWQHYLDDDTAGANDAGLGLARCSVTLGLTQAEELRRAVGITVGQKNFFAEFIAKQGARTASGIWEMGFYTASGVSLAYPAMGFCLTGPSGIMSLTWRPTGGSQTMVSLGVNPGITAYHRYTIERFGATLTVYYDDAKVLAIQSPIFGRDNFSQSFGVRSVDNGHLVWIDRAELRVDRRNP